MGFVTIHESGTGADKFTVNSYFNGLAYNFSFGQAGTPMRNIYVQGDDASAMRAEFDGMEETFPHMKSRDIWITILDPYL